MTKKRILNVLLFAILTFLVVLFIFKPFQTSDLEEWSNEVSYDTYKDAINLLESSVENGRYTYYDFLEEVNMNYNLPSHDAVLTTLNSSETYGYEGNSVANLGTGLDAIYTVDIIEDGYYVLDLDYFVTGDILNNITMSVAINGEFQFDDAKTIDAVLYWEDSTKEFQTDSYGDETLPTQIKIEEWREFDLYNNTYTSNEPLLFYFEEGINTIQFTNVSSGDLFLGDLEVNPPKYIKTYQEYISNYSAEASEYNLFINAIDYTEKNSSYVRLFSFGNPSLSPFDSVDKKLNVIDGGAWYKAGQEVTYSVDVEETGLYDIAFHYANYKGDFQSFRSIKIDGEIPFKEVASYAFDYTPTNWANEVLNDELGNPYKIYLEKGTHTITLRAEKNEVSRELRDIQLMIDHINQFALEIIKITGKDIDKDRTWKITNYISETEDYLQAYQDILKFMVINLSQYSEKDDLSSSLSYLKKAVIEFDKMLEKPDELPLYLPNLYSGDTSVTLMLGNSLTSIADQQLYLDGFYVSNNGEYEKPNASIFKRMGATIESFFSSYTSDKYNIENSDDVINVWVNRPITYVDIMQKMADSQFYEETGVKVKISVMPDPTKLILANSAGNTPDVALGLLSYMPFDLAIREALYDLSTFDDFWLTANNFAPGALVPYI